MSDYTEDDIFTPERLDKVRRRPTQYFHSRGIEGLIHQALEIITNSIDEIALLDDLVGRLVVLVCRDHARSTYQIIVWDTGRGVPIKRLLDSYTKLDTSGKYDTKAYIYSGGLFGVGAKATAGSSRYFRAITHRPEGSASIYVEEGKTDEKVELLKKPPLQTGTTVLFEPDPLIFTMDIPTFCEDGIPQIHVLIQKYCYFRRLNIEFKVNDNPLPDTVWKAPIKEAESIIQKHIDSATTLFTESSLDRTAWIRGYWGVHRPFALNHMVRDTMTVQMNNKEPTTAWYVVHCFYVKFDPVGGRFGMINNVPIDDVKSTHFTAVIDVLKSLMAGLIKDVPVRRYFVENYRIPVYLAVELKLPGAEFAGTTKHAFISREFRNQYIPSLQAQLKTPDSVAFITALYNELAEDIESKYLTAETGVAKVKNVNRLFEELRWRGRFKDCSTTDRLSAELFLVEGESAGGGSEGRNSVIQGSYELSGKPLNAISSIDEVNKSAIDLRKNDIYKDILKITGINPVKFDYNTLNYGKIIITTDADEHGYHMSSILVGNFYALCPEMLEAGMLYVVTPPLYSIEPVKKTSKSQRIYLRNHEELQEWMATNVYMKAYAFGTRAIGHDTSTYYMTGQMCVNFLINVLFIGEAIRNIANELVLPPAIVERLIHVVDELDPTDGTAINTKRIKTKTGLDRVEYNPEGHILILTQGREDHVVPLQNVKERLSAVVLPAMNRIQWKTSQIYITSKTSQLYQDQPMLISDIYDILIRFNNDFSIKRYKGLGSMPPLDRNRTCMDPKYRKIYPITSVGETRVIFELLGDDSTYRKQITSRKEVRL